MLRTKGEGTYGGKLRLNFTDNYIPQRATTIITDGDPEKNGVFSSVETTGMPSGYQVGLICNGHSVQIQAKKK